EGRRQRAVPQGLRLGREAAHAPLHRRLHEGEARAPAPDVLRAGAVLQEPDLHRRGRAAGAEGSLRRLAMLVLLACVAPARGGELAVSPQALRGVDASALAYTYAIGSFAPEYTPPAPGTYELPVIDTLDDHPLVGE